MSAGGQHLKDEGSRKQVVIAGGVAGLVSRFCIAPLDVVKIRLQLQVHEVRPLRPNAYGALPTVKKILREEGIRGFWRGNVPAELLYVTYGATQFTAYRSISSVLSTTNMPSSVTAFASGAVAGAAATAITYPLDLLRTRFAAQTTNRVYHSFLGSFLLIAKEEGIKGLFQGLGAGLGQIVPYMGLFFAIYEGFRPLMADMQLPFGSGDAAAGILASTFAKTGVFPLDLIRKRLQIQGPSRSRFAEGAVPEYGRGVLKIGQTILRNEGWLGLYRGLGVSLIKAAPASAVTMWTYERALRELREWNVVR